MPAYGRKGSGKDACIEVLDVDGIALGPIVLMYSILEAISAYLPAVWGVFV